MANWYIWSGATGAGTGADWANAYTTLAAATVKAVSDVFFVAHDHVETQASAKTITFPGTEASPNRVYCADRAGSVPPVPADLRNTAQILTTGASSISIGGSLNEVYGLIIQAGDSTNSATINLGAVSNKSQIFKNCSFRLGGSATTSRITWNSSANANTVIADNCTVQFSNVSQFMNTAGRAIWKNTLSPILGAILPTTLLSFSAPGSWLLEGIDLSALTTGKNLVNGATTTASCTALFKDCKLGAGVAISTAPTAFGGPDITLLRSDSADTNYRFDKRTFGAHTSTQIAIYRNDGATDGVTPISWLFTVNTNRWPGEAPPITIWNEVVGTPITVTIEGAKVSGPVADNKDIWIDVYYPGTSGYPIASKATTGVGSVLDTLTNYPASASTWTGAATAYSMSVTITPTKKGPITIYVRGSTTSQQHNICPKPVIT